MRFYRTGEFAQKAGVSARTLRFYDREGLLSPTRVSEAGYRLYSDDDLATLQKILALKFLGFTLGEVRAFAGEPEALGRTLAKQKAMMQDQRSQLDTIIRAIENAEGLLEAGTCDWEALVHIIEVIGMEKKKDWVDQYFTPEAQGTIKELGDKSYSDEAKAKLAEATWTEEDQRRIDAQYAELAADLKRLVAAGADPSGPEGQRAAKRQVELLSAFTKNDPDVTAGLKTWWQNYDALPEAEKPPVLPWGEAEGAFLQQAVKIYKQRAADEA